MVRKPTFAGKANKKDELDILYWANEKTASDRLQEAWRLHCMNMNVPTNIRMDKKANKAQLRNGEYI